MASTFIDFTGAPIKVTANVVQPMTQALDLGGYYRVLDLVCNVYSLTGTSPTVTVSILTSPQNAIEVPQWPSLGGFGQISTADTAQRVTLTGALRYVRYGIAVTGTTPVAYLDIKGYARTRE